MDIWKKINWVNHKCAETDLEELKKLTDEARERIDYVLKGGKILQANSDVIGKLQLANKRLEDVSKAIGEASSLCKDIRAITDIHDAMDILNTELIMKDPKAAAKAFDKLFGAFGVLCRHLPPPANQWATFFEQVGDFFENMLVPLDPLRRSSGREQWPQVEQ
jgi:hypothetical protein